MSNYKDTEQEQQTSVNWKSIAISAAVTATVLFVTQFILEGIFQRIGWRR